MTYDWGLLFTNLGWRGRVGKEISLDAVSVGLKNKNFQKSFWIFLEYTITSVHPTRWTRVISGRFNREIVTARELCQVFWLRIILDGKAGTRAGNKPLLFNFSSFNIKNFRAFLFLYGLKLKQFEKINGSKIIFNLNKCLFRKFQKDHFSES